MKKLLFALAVLAVIVSSCGKDEETDNREQFVGTWQGTQTINIPSIDYTESFTGINTITKNTTESNVINIMDGSEIAHAAVTGSSYVYDKRTYTEAFEGQTATIEITGGGVINGNTITESGIIKYFYLGQTFSGTWTCTLTRQ